MYIKIYNLIPDAAREIRTEVFVVEQGFIYEFDEIDNQATHFVLYNESDIPVGTCRVFKGDEPNIYILGRLAVLKIYRYNGYGKMIVEEAEKYVKSICGECLMLHSQCSKKDFYKNLGYIEFGDVEYEEDCPHIWMKKYL